MTAIDADKQRRLIACFVYAKYNVMVFNESKFPVNAPAKVKRDFTDPDPAVYTAGCIGVQPTNQSSNMLCLDWDGLQTDPPANLKKYLTLYRDYPDNGKSWRGFLWLTDTVSLAGFASDNKFEDLELLFDTKGIALLGSYKLGHGYDDNPARPAWQMTVEPEDVIKFVTFDELQAALKGVPKKTEPIKEDTIPTEDNEAAEDTDNEKITRHDTILAYVQKELKKINKTDRTFDKGMEIAMTAVKSLDNGEIFKPTGSRYAEVERIVKWCIEHQGDKLESSIIKMLRPKYRLVHVEPASGNSKFNTHYWDYAGKRWKSNFPYKIMQHCNWSISIIDTKMAESISGTMSADKQTLLIELDSEKYIETRRHCITAGGQIYDFRTGKLREIDPSMDYFPNPDLKVPIVKSGPPMHFEAFLNARFGDSWQIVRDHIAKIFLPNAIFDAKAKALHIVGSRDTYKSLVAFIIDMIFDESVVRESKLEDFEKDKKFIRAREANGRVSKSEEDDPRLMRSISGYKDIITSTGGPYREMHTTETKHAWTYPTQIKFMNKVQPIPYNDDDESVFIRIQYLKTLEVKADTEEAKAGYWYAKFDKEEIIKVVWYLLARAQELYNKPSCMHTQTLQESKEVYESLMFSDLTDMLKDRYKPDPSEENPARWPAKRVLKDYRQHTKSKISMSAFLARLDELPQDGITADKGDPWYGLEIKVIPDDPRDTAYSVKSASGDYYIEAEYNTPGRTKERMIEGIRPKTTLD